MPECPQLARQVGAIDIGVTADQVRLFAHQVDQQIEGVNQDAVSAASDPKVNWDLRLGTSWLSFYHAWKDELAVADSNDWLTFGLGTEYERIRDWQAQAKDWQARIAKISGRQSSVPIIKDTTTAGDLETYGLVAAGGAAAALLLLLILKR
jgi:hypothetical protein